jgi:hypothetical protein
LHYGEAAIELAKIYMSKQGGRKTAIDLLRRAQSMNRAVISDDSKEEASLLSQLPDDY